MRRGFVVQAVLGIFLIGPLHLGCTSWPTAQTDSARPSTLDIRQINKAATDAKSPFLDAAGRIHAVETFQRLVSIKGPSGQEELVRKEVQRLLTEAGAVVVPARSGDPEAPANLIMEIPGSGDLASRSGILLNAHLDTIAQSTPEFLAFDDGTGDFYHLHAAASGKPSSFGGDDRAAVAVVVEAVRLLQAKYWSRGVPHRRILLAFTAEEERGCVGARYLSQHEPGLFADLVMSLSIDGPLDQESDYPRDSFVAVVSASDAALMPYKHVLRMIQDFSGCTGARFGRTEYGLGRGDFAHFPPSARAGLHLRSAVRGFHRTERVNIQDLIGQIDLLCYLLLDWDCPGALQKAAADGDIDTLKSQIEKGALVDEREAVFFRTALHRAAMGGNKEAAELLLSHGANPNTPDSSGFCALHYAAINGNKEIVGLLIAKGADVNAKDAAGNTPLSDAVRNSHKDMAEMLLKKGAEPSIHAAAFLGHIDSIRSLIETGTSIDANDSGGLTALHYAIAAGHYDAAKFLIAKGARVNVKDIWPFGTPLHCAVESGRKELVELLADAGAEVNTSKNRPAGDTPLHSAVRAGHNDIVEILASHGADLNVKDNSGQLPLDIAISQNRKDTIDLLLAKGAEVPSIHTAARMGSVKSIKAFLEKGTNINEKDSSGLSPLHIAVSGSITEVVAFLLAEGADANARDNENYTPLNFAIWNRNREMPGLPVDMARLLLEKGADTNVKDSPSGYTPLHWAVIMWSNELAELIIGAGADVNARSKAGETPLDIIAASGGPAATGDLLVAKGAAASSLHAAAYVGDQAKAKAFIDEGVEVNRPSGMVGGTALHAAAARGHTEVAASLIDKGADVDAQTRAGQTPLHTAAGAGHSDVAQLLVSKGADVNAKDSRGRTPLSLAEKAGHSGIVDLLRKHGAKQ